GRPLMLAWLQFLAAGTAGTLAAMIANPPPLAIVAGHWRELLWAGAISTGIAFTLQVVAQRYAQPAIAAIVMGSEILFAVLAGALFLGERLAAAQLAGGALIFVAILAVEAVPQLGLWSSGS